jgi:hypothetical protein
MELSQDFVRMQDYARLLSDRDRLKNELSAVLKSEDAWRQAAEDNHQEICALKAVARQAKDAFMIVRDSWSPTSSTLNCQARNAVDVALEALRKAGV